MMHLPSIGMAFRKQRGITLLELMIVVGIIAVVSAFAYPSYTQYIVNTKRAVATSVLLQVADRQQQFFIDNKQFTNDMTDLGFAADPLILKDDGTDTNAADGDAVYSIALSNVVAVGYTVTAAPLYGQATRDTDCASLTLDQAGVRGNSAGGDKCW
jgi:type IV pilus assembly protein PilE